MRRLSKSSLLGCLRFVVFTVFFYICVSVTRSPGNVAIVKKKKKTIDR